MNQLHPIMAKAIAPFVQSPKINRLASSEDVTNDFIKQIEAGYIHPDHMADVIYAMHSAMVDRFDRVALWLPNDLEQVADTIVCAIRMSDKVEA